MEKLEAHAKKVENEESVINYVEATNIADLKTNKVKNVRKEDIINIIFNSEIEIKKENKNEETNDNKENKFQNFTKVKSSRQFSQNNKSKSKVKEFINGEYKPFFEKFEKKDMNDDENPNNEIVKYLMSNKNLGSNIGSKKNLFSPRGNSAKTKNNIANLAVPNIKSKKKMDQIMSDLNNEFVKNYTFSPKTKANFTKTNSKPNLNQFLTNQNNHIKKVEDKIALKKEQVKQKDEDYEKENKFVASEVILKIIIKT